MADVQNQGIAPLDPTSAVGQVRMLLGDTDPRPLEPVVDGQGIYLWQSDAEIASLLTLYGSNPRRCGAQLLRTIAVSQALLLKRWTAGELDVNGPAITDALLKAADAMDKQADGDDNAAAIDYVNIVPTGGIIFPTYAELEDPDTSYARRNIWVV